jgi:hypothetical protein
MYRTLIAVCSALAISAAAYAQSGGPFAGYSVEYYLGPTIGKQWHPAGAFLGGVNAQTGTTYTVLGTDNGKLVTLSNAAAVAVTLPQAGTTGFGTNKLFRFTNLGQTLATITPTTSTINGAAALILANGDSVTLLSDGTNYQTIGIMPGSKSCTVTGTTPQTCNGTRGVATTGTLTTAGAATAADYVINNSNVAAASVVNCTIGTYAGTLTTNGLPVITKCVVGAGTITVSISNAHASNALNGAVGIHFSVMN